MTRIKLLLVALFALAPVTAHSPLASAEPMAGNNPKPTLYKKTDFPVGVEFHQDPKDKQVIYCLITRERLKADTSNAQTKAQMPPGLYGSTDAGATWALLTEAFQFKQVFIHPNTGELFAIIEDNTIAPRADGFLAVQHFDKAVVSTDGKQWKDIMGQQQRVAGLSHIFIDPDHPNRVRLIGSSIGSGGRYYLIAADDSYSAWKRVSPRGTLF